VSEQLDLFLAAREPQFDTAVERCIFALLKRSTLAQPIRISQIQAQLRHEAHRLVSDREIKDFVRTLRREHGMPIAARRSKRPGYYWCRSAEEMEPFVDMFNKQFSDERATLRKMILRNYPSLLSKLSGSGEGLYDGE